MAERHQCNPRILGNILMKNGKKDGTRARTLLWSFGSEITSCLRTEVRVQSSVLPGWDLQEKDRDNGRVSGSERSMSSKGPFNLPMRWRWKWALGRGKHWLRQHTILINNCSLQSRASALAAQKDTCLEYPVTPVYSESTCWFLKQGYHPIHFRLSIF